MSSAWISAEALRQDLVVCVLFFNKLEQTLECIRSFLPSRVAVHVLDNGSEPAAVEAMRAALEPHPQVRMLDAGGNRGVAAGRNLQVADTDQRWLLFVDNDITVATHNWLERLAAHLSACPEADVHVPRLFNKHESGWGYLADFLVDEAGRCTFIRTDAEFGNSFPGGASVIDRRLFARVGPYDEDLFVGFEDFELAIRAWQQGSPVLVRRADDIVLIHDHRVSAAVADREAAKVRYDVRRISHSHAVIHRKRGVLLDPNFSDWLDEQVRQLTGDHPSREGGEGATTAQPFAVQGVTVTPIRCEPAQVLLLVPADEARPERVWMRLRALATARARARDSGLQCRTRLLVGRDGTDTEWLEAAREAGLIDEWLPARAADGRLVLGPLDPFDLVGWVGAGLVSGDWLTRSVQSLQFRQERDSMVVHPATLLLVGGPQLRVERGTASPLVDPWGAAGRSTLLAAAAQWRRFESGHYTRHARSLSEAMHGWLYESARVGAVQHAQPGTALLLPQHGVGAEPDPALAAAAAAQSATQEPWAPWLWFEQHNLVELTRHLLPMPDWATMPVVRAEDVTPPRPGLQSLIDGYREQGITHLLVLPWLRRGGADKAALCYLQALASRAPGRILALTTEPGHSPWERFVPPGAAVVDWTAVAPWGSTEESLAALLRLLAETRVRALHVMNSQLGWQLLARHGERVRSIVRTYASLFWYGPSRAERLLGYASEWLPAAIGHLDAVITDNRSFGERLHRDYGYPRGLFRCVYHPVREIADAPIGARRGAPRVLWASRFAPEKRIDLLLELARELPGVEFLVYGEPAPADDPLAATAEALAALPNVRLGGHFDGFESLPLADCSAFLYTSSSDGMPNVVVEAMSAGLPVVAPDVGGIRELVDDATGWLVSEPGSRQAYQAALEQLLADREQASRRAAAGLERIRQRHSFESFVRQLRAVPGYLN